MLAFYIFPAVERSGPDGGKIMQAVTGVNKFSQVLALTASITILSGLLLMWELSSGFTPSWFSSRYGAALGIGGITAIVAFAQGMIINRPGVMRMQSIGQAVAARGGAPSEEERNELMRLRKRVYLSTQWLALWIIITVVAMGGARYF
jgi:hypothetical protein